MEYQDIKLTCLCGEPFIWTRGEQKFLQSLIDDGKMNRDGTPITFIQPKRCAPCRKWNKEKRERRAWRNEEY